MPRLIPALCTVLILNANCKGPAPDANTDRASEGEPAAEMPFYLGTYTDGQSEGIYRYVPSGNGSLRAAGLMARTENPSFLAFSPDGQYLLAVNEVSDAGQTGYLSSFDTGNDTLLLLDRKPSGGAHPCHVVANGAGYVVVANYSGGNMGLLRIREDGRLSDLLDVQQHEGKGTHPRQEAPHAHSGWFGQDGSVISVDLGTNQLWFSEIDTDTGKFVSREPRTFSLPPGAGPRHLVLHPTSPWLYVINELSSSVSLLRTDPEIGGMRLAQTISTLPEDFDLENTCADIHISADGKFLYASNRGHDSIAVYSVDPVSGELQLLGLEPTKGKGPRNFSLSPDGKFLLVANQNTNNLVSFSRNESTGLLSYASQMEAPSPVCILFEPVR